MNAGTLLTNCFISTNAVSCKQDQIPVISLQIAQSHCAPSTEIGSCNLVIATILAGSGIKSSCVMICYMKLIA